MDELLIDSEDIITLCTNRLLNNYNRPANTLLSDISHAQSSSGGKIKLALASSSKSHSYRLKTSSLETKQLLDFFQPEHQILGGNARLYIGRGKTAPNVCLMALESLNSAHDAEDTIKPDECLVFEDSVTGVEAGKVGMDVLGDDCQLWEIDDGWTERMSGLGSPYHTRHVVQFSM
ncbi:hypothetical protein COCMIDRAFT_37417 [Bipolaris oryzae ATCC 44560]|uniref:Uncharacterized protein n=1 Tax=Bipolaris oryzae ATCC 44560 TaxID=930090 RepID=W6Z4E1_COCMI|nr:uncharacterized protein COCMIDRAFT_37417 [Bipolaris oryzae ATCC 44560]EUC44800.1 hypothetical protein COCMIDRAFT_37417 [Bipolaris oryzae ATCC 44560]